MIMRLMAYSTYKLIGVFLAFTLHILPSFPVIPKSKLSLRLINRHSILSSHYSSTVDDDDIRAPAMPNNDGAMFLVNISIGNPPVPQLLYMDTGSPIVWVRCFTTTSCNGCDNTFDPGNSSTYRDVPVNAPPCTTFDYDLEEDQGKSPCSYAVTYMDSSFSKGFLAFERYTLMTSSESTVQVPDAVVGCALETRPPDFGGVLGLISSTEYHLIARTGNKFSYCIGNISDPQYMYNQLILGDGAIFQGDSTPMETRDDLYVVSLEGISVGEAPLMIDPEDFQYNVVIDSGATHTSLRSSAYQPLVTEVMLLLDDFLRRVKVINALENQLCYEGDLERDLKGFPVVTLHLAEGADVALDVEGMFQRTTNGLAFCLAIVESEHNKIGIISQQFYNVGFDVEAKRVSFQRIDCELLED